jgi:hypothetical protein
MAPVSPVLIWIEDVVKYAAPPGLLGPQSVTNGLLPSLCEALVYDLHLFPLITQVERIPHVDVASKVLPRPHRTWRSDARGFGPDWISVRSSDRGPGVCSYEEGLSIPLGDAQLPPVEDF